MRERPAAIVLDPVGGVSGDMFVAAMLDALPELVDPVLDAIRRAGLPPELKVALIKRRSSGIAASGLAFEGKLEAPTGDYRAFRERIAATDLSATIKRHALGILHRLAEAEAAIHDVPVDRVHFHEIADWDTQADVVAAAAIIDALHPATWHCRPLPLGSGTVEAAHGLLPVPAPATARLLKGFAFRADDGIPGERVTPTGAAILAYLDAAAITAPSGRLIATGTGAGTKQLPGAPNILRVLALANVAASSQSILVVEFDIDDQSPEDAAIALDNIRVVEGVRDVVSFQGLGKKGRWVQAVRVMADPAARDALAEAIFSETTTLGLRIREDARVTLPRRAATVEDETGIVRVKIAERPGGVTAKAEADDVARASGATGRATLRKRVTRRALEGEQ